jgi:SAM-dependent methyltransferase
MELIEILQCPACKGPLDNELNCLRCKHAYKKDNDIYELMPDVQTPMPSAFSDINYLKLHRISSGTDEYFYQNRNPMVNWVSSSGYRQIVKMMGKESGLVLECGCGSGAFLMFNKNIDLNEYVMLDIDQEALRSIKKRNCVGGVIHGSSYKLPFMDNSFDTVMSHAHLEHLLFLDIALDEIRRVLKPGGKFIASVPTEGGFLWTSGRLFTTARYFKKMLDIDYIRANMIDHCNVIYQIERAIRRYFDVKKRGLFPLRIPSFHFNLTSTYLSIPLK